MLAAPNQNAGVAAICFHDMRTLYASFLIALTLLPVWGCRNKARDDASIFPPAVTLQEGDIVFRRGTGLTAQAVLYADEEGLFSHVGIVAKQRGQWMVVHAVPDEPDFPGDIDRVKAEGIDKFYAMSRAAAGKVLRYADAEVARRAAGKALRMLADSIPFDHAYNSADSSKLYCCELVERAYIQAGASLVGTGRHNIDYPSLHLRNVVMPGDYRNVASLTEIIQF